MNIKYKTKLSESFRADLEPNGCIVRCIKDLGDDYIIATSDEETQPNTYLIHKKDLYEI